MMPRDWRCAAGAPRTGERTGRRSKRMICNEGDASETRELPLYLRRRCRRTELRFGRPAHGRGHRAEVEDNDTQWR